MIIKHSLGNFSDFIQILGNIVIVALNFLNHLIEVTQTDSNISVSDRDFINKRNLKSCTMPDDI